MQVCNFRKWNVLLEGFWSISSNISSKSISSNSFSSNCFQNISIPMASYNSDTVERSKLLWNLAALWKRNISNLKHSRAVTWKLFAVLLVSSHSHKNFYPHSHKAISRFRIVEKRWQQVWTQFFFLLNRGQ